MIQHILLCVIMLFSISEGRFYKTPHKVLTSQDAKDIAPVSNYTAPDYRGYTNYEGLDVHTNKTLAINDASRLIRKKVAQGLRQHFGKIRASLTAFADDDGFVREGIVFCGASTRENNLGPFTVSDTMPSDFNEEGARLIDYDGWGIVENANDQVKYDRQQCGINNCQEGSVVATLSNEIRATGYQIQHRDLCSANANTVVLEARTANMVAYQNSSAVVCDGSSTDSWYELLRDCVGFDSSNCGNKCTINSNDGEKEDGICRVDTAKVQGCNDVAPGDDKEDENIDDTKTKINAIRRVTRYSLNSQISAVQTTDYAYFTGCKSGGCTTLRNLFAALNGNAQVSAFRDLNVEESIAYWEKEIHSSRTYLQGLADTFRAFRPITMDLFPFIEEEEIEGCPMGEIEYKTDEDSGSEPEPLCYRKSLDLGDLNKLSRDGQFIPRSECFCRNGKLELNTDGNETRIDIEKDDIYLSVADSEATLAECDKMPTSVRSYCRDIASWGSRGPWKSVLESLLPAATIGRIKIYDDDHTQFHLKRQRIVDNIANTLPGDVDTSCGRIVNADSTTSTDPSKLMISNKGGNCMPFPKLYEIIYRLEYETGEQGMGAYACETTKSCSAQPTIAESFCAGKLESSELSFRQMSYKWDVADSQNDKRVLLNDPFVGNPIQSIESGFLTYTGETYTNPGTTTSVDRSFCLVDWLTEFGLTTITDSAGIVYPDPFVLFKKYIDEAVFNTELAQSTKQKVITDNILIWKAIRKELTTAEDGNILDDISGAAANHYLLITSTDTDLIVPYETFTAAAKVREQIEAFTAEVEPLRTQLPVLKTTLDNIVNQTLQNDTIINATITSAFNTIFNTLNTLTNSPILPRRRTLASRRLAPGDSDCVQCFEDVNYTRSDSLRQTAANNLRMEDLVIAQNMLKLKQRAKDEAQVLYDLLADNDNKKRLENANYELHAANVEVTMLGTVKTWIDNEKISQSGISVSVAAKSNAVNVETAAQAALTAATTARNTALFAWQTATHTLKTEETSNNPVQSVITQAKAMQGTAKKNQQLAEAHIVTATNDIVTYTRTIHYADNWEADYWDYIPRTYWEPDIVDKISARSVSCNACKSDNGADTLTNVSRTLPTILQRPTRPQLYSEVKTDVLEDIRRNIASINLDLTIVLQDIDGLKRNDTTREDVTKSTARISTEIQNLWTAVSDFEGIAILDLQTLAEYSRNKDAYDSFWDATNYTGIYATAVRNFNSKNPGYGASGSETDNEACLSAAATQCDADNTNLGTNYECGDYYYNAVTANTKYSAGASFNITKHELPLYDNTYNKCTQPWPEKNDVVAVCISMLHNTFNKETVAAAGILGYDRTSTYDVIFANTQVLLNELDTSVANNMRPETVFINQNLIMLDTMLRDYEMYCLEGPYMPEPNPPVGLTKDYQTGIAIDNKTTYDTYVATCETQYPFGTTEECDKARNAILVRNTRNLAFLATAKGVAMTARNTILEKEVSVRNYITQIQNNQNIQYDSNKILFGILAETVLTKYKLIGLPATGTTNLNASLVTQRDSCRAEIQTVVTATKWLINNNKVNGTLLKTYKADGNTEITASAITMPNNVSDALALHALLEDVTNNFTFVPDNNLKLINDYMDNVISPVNATGRDDTCLATGIEGIVFNNQSVTTSIFRQIYPNIIKVKCKSGHGFSDASQSCQQGICDVGDFGNITDSGDIICTACPAGQYGDSTTLTYSTTSTGTECIKCQSGKYSTGSAAGCTFAGTGHYALADQTDRAECPVGTYAATRNVQAMPEGTSNDDLQAMFVARGECGNVCDQNGNCQYVCGVASGSDENQYCYNKFGANSEWTPTAARPLRTACDTMQSTRSLCSYRMYFS